MPNIFMKHTKFCFQNWFLELIGVGDMGNDCRQKDTEDHDDEPW
jgi:hypothetical protein